jgi:hypothetical protein
MRTIVPGSVLVVVGILLLVVPPLMMFSILGSLSEWWPTGAIAIGGLLAAVLQYRGTATSQATVHDDPPLPEWVQAEIDKREQLKAQEQQRDVAVRSVPEIRAWHHKIVKDWPELVSRHEREWQAHQSISALLERIDKLERVHSNVGDDLYEVADLLNKLSERNSTNARALKFQLAV